MSNSQVDYEPGFQTTEQVEIQDLLRADSPRSSGESDEHVRLLAESGAALPPILVHRSTMRVIDGMHRLRSAALRGEKTIEVRYYDGSDEDAFILAVETNTRHGLPLSLADRTAAAVRIIAIRPEWSDRRVASVAGLAASTVGSIRRRSTVRSGQSNTTNRMGLDGKVRPLDSAARRIRVSELIKARPHAPIREIAAAAGVSPSTALDVRNRLRDGEHPVPGRPPSAGPTDQSAQRGRSTGDEFDKGRSDVLRGMDEKAVLLRLNKDPSLRFTDTGRSVLRWLTGRTIASTEWDEYARIIPPHCTEIVAELARRNATTWLGIAESLER